MHVGAKAYRNCSQDGKWATVINVDECRSASLDILSKRIQGILNSTAIDTTELSAISERLPIITNTSGVTVILPTHLNTTNSILASVIRLDFLHYIKKYN